VVAAAGAERLPRRRKMAERRLVAAGGAVV